MSLAIAVSGKGGTGKTTLSALLVRLFRERGKTPILAIDADPNSNLHEVLGLKDAIQPVGGLREEMLKNVERIPAGVPKESWVEYQLAEALTEAEGFDLLVMGRPEGPGCYCYINSVLRKYIDLLGGNYPVVVMDNEAGMEHLSRKTTRNADVLLLVSDATPRGMKTAARIRDLAEQEELKIGRTFFVINRLTGELGDLAEHVAANGLKLLGTVPEDEVIGEFERTGRSLFELPEDSPALTALGRMLDAIVEGLSPGSKEVA